VEPSPTEDLVPLLLAASALTASETAIAHHVLRGRSNKDIARTLSITPLTVQQHLKGVFEKIGVHGRGELLSRLHGPHHHEG
jgi:DNA-binding CsgD family transcriptional regulator